MKLWLILALVAASDPVATGVLEVRTQPEVEVIWEGTRLGATGSGGLLTIAGIPSGEYAVTLRKTGFEETNTRITAGAGEKTVLVLRLEPSAEPLALEDLVPWEERTTAPAIAAARSENAVLPAAIAGETSSSDPVSTAAPPAAAGQDPSASSFASGPEARPSESPAVAAQEPAPEPSFGRRLPGWLWILGALGLLAAWLANRQRKASASDPGVEQPATDPAWVKAGPATPPLHAKVVPASPMPPASRVPATADPAFLEELKRREHRLEPDPEDDVIDVEFAEVRPAGREP